MSSLKNKTEKNWAKELKALTLFVEDINQTKKFYEDLFSLPIVFEDDQSVAFEMGSLILNFLKISEAVELVAPAKVGIGESGTHSVLTIHVPDVDKKCKELKTRGLDFLLEPINRPWGLRTANFADPDGHIWEIATPIDKQT